MGYAASKCPDAPLGLSPLQLSRWQTSTSYFHWLAEVICRQVRELWQAGLVLAEGMAHVCELDRKFDELLLTYGVFTTC